MYNLVGTGRQWFGELFDFTTTQNFPLPFPPKQGTTMNVEANAVARSSVSSTSLTILNGGNNSISGHRFEQRSSICYRKNTQFKYTGLHNRAAYLQ